MFRYRTIHNETQKIWSGLPKIPTYNPKVSAGQILLEVLALQPHKIGQINNNNGIQLTNKDIRLKSIRAAENLLKLGFGKCDNIMIIAKNNHQLAPIVIACLTIGTPFNALDPNLNAGDIAHMLCIIKPSLIICDLEIVTTVKDAMGINNISVDLFTFDGKVDNTRMVDELLNETGTEKYFVCPDIGDGTKHIAAIICSSGTSGLPKGVCLSHAAILELVHNMLPSTSEDIALCFSSLYWISGFGTFIATTLRGATRLITTESFSPELMLQLIEKYKVSVVLTTPSIVAQLIFHPMIETTDLSSLSYYLCGGSLISKILIEKMNKYLPNAKVYSAYGLSESGGGIISHSYPLPKVGSVGQLVSGYTVKIINKAGEKCNINEDGELCVFSKYPFLGYYGNEKATLETLDNDGWIHTGDIGHFDEDGYLFISGREKDILKYNNYHITPSEIEEVILNHPGVHSVCVVGIPDLIFTDLPAAVVIKRDSKVTEEELNNMVKDKLSNFKQLRGGIYFVDSLPMTSSGKVINRKVKEIAIKLYEKNNGLSKL